MTLYWQVPWCHDKWYTEISLVWSATNIFCASELVVIQFGFDPCSTSCKTQTELAASVSWQFAALLHVPPLRFQRIILQSFPPDTNMLFGWNLGKCTWDALEVCLLRHWSAVNFFLPSNLKSWMLPLPKWEIKFNKRTWDFSYPKKAQINTPPPP